MGCAASAPCDGQPMFRALEPSYHPVGPDKGVAAAAACRAELVAASSPFAAAAGAAPARSAGSAGSRSSDSSQTADVLATVESVEALTDVSDPKAALGLRNASSSISSRTSGLPQRSTDLGMQGLWLQTGDADADACWADAGAAEGHDGGPPFSSQNGLVLDPRRLSGSQLSVASHTSGSHLSGSMLPLGGTVDVVPTSFALRPAPAAARQRSPLLAELGPEPPGAYDLNPAFHSAPATIQSKQPQAAAFLAPGVGSLSLGPAGAGRGGGPRAPHHRPPSRSGSFRNLQSQLAEGAEPLRVVSTRAAGLKHIGFGPFKNENQDEFFIQVGHFGSQPGANLFCVFDGHGAHGKPAAATARQVLPALLDAELRTYAERNPGALGAAGAGAMRGAVEVIMSEVFAETERSLMRAGVDLSSSGTTATAALQVGNRLWVAAAGDSRALLCRRAAPGAGAWRPQPLTLDHRPRRPSERERVIGAGAKVMPKRLPSGQLVGEPRMWLQDMASGPGLLISRSLGDLMASSVGCTSEPEVAYTTLMPGRDQFIVIASDGIWDVLSNEQVCDIVTDAPDPQVACRRVLDAALFEWEERMSADNISVVIVEFDWSHVIAETDSAGAAARAALQLAPSGQQQPVRAPRAPARVARQPSARRASMEVPGEYSLPSIREGPTSYADD